MNCNGCRVDLSGKSASVSVVRYLGKPVSDSFVGIECTSREAVGGKMCNSVSVDAVEGKEV